MSAATIGTAPVLEVRGTRIALRRIGSGEPLLFLHGPRGIDEPSPLIDRLARCFTVLAPDHPGFGQSDDADRLDTIADMAMFYLDVLDQLDLRGVHVVGHSLGAWIALELAIRNATRLRSLTLASAAGIRVEGVPRGDMYIATPAELGRLLFHEPEHQETVARAEEDPNRIALITKNRNASAKLTWHPRLYDPHLAKWLHRITLPTLVLWGDADRVIPPAHAREFVRLIPQARSVTIPACGHMSDVECPDAFAEAVIAFAGELAP
ncbi:MAG TPA: alpha/beta hydrolase [Candidatus Aquilonibacter sp.]